MNKAMHKNEFIKADASRVVNATLKLIAETLRQGDKVVLTGFGTFEMRQRSARQGINPQSRAPITISASATPGFTASATFKNQVNQAARNNSSK